ncbi:MAG: FecR domain-containing protein [Burkholderiaceae bacterium]|nr:FecR domain-containing protein [Burkholderiaceae bacterium]
MGAAQAQITPMPRGGDVIAHRVVAGDTLEQLAARYLGDHRQWSLLQQHNGVANPYRLRPGSVLEIPSRLLRAAAASVEFVQGDVRASRPLDHLADTPATGVAPSPVRQGQALQEGDRLQLAPDAFVAVRLADGSLVRVQSQSDVLLRQMRRKGRAGSLQSVLDLREGSVEATVAPDAQAGQRRFEIRTPAASTSVRGTRFLVQTHGDADSGTGTVAAVDHGSVAVDSTLPAAQGGGTLLHPGQGLAVAADGRIGQARDMLDAPDTSAWPALAEDANWVSLPLPTQAGAVRYQVMLARDAELTQVLRNGSFTASPLRLSGVEDGDYVLSIRGVDAQGVPGRASSHALRVKAHPVPPLYEAPAADAVVGLGRAGLQCTRVVGAARYRIQVAAAAPDADAFAHPVVDARDLQDCGLAAEALASLPAGRYLWRAASVRLLPDGQADQGPFAAPQGLQLAVAPRQPSADALQLDGGQGQGSRHIRWSGEAGQRYRVQAASGQDFAQPLVDVWVDRPEWSTEALPPGNYFMRLQIEDANGLRSEFSAARQFQTGSWITDASGRMLHMGHGDRLQRQ